MTDTLTLPKGYCFHFPGAPDARVVDAPLPDDVRLGLMHPTQVLTVARVDVGQAVKTGQIVAESEACPAIKLVSPITGKVTETVETHGIKRALKPGFITIVREGDEDNWETGEGASETPEHISVETAREMLIQAGLWPSIKELPQAGPAASTDGDPQALVVKCVFSEPFMPKGNAILTDHVDEFERGLEYFQRATSGYTRLHLILTAPMAKLTQDIGKAIHSRAWITPCYVDRVYPAENDKYLFKLLFGEKARDPNFRAWFVDAQTVLAVGACLAHGKPSVERILSVAGPCVKSPEHVRVRVGSKIDDVLAGRLEPGENRIVRGGVLTGQKIAEEDARIGPMDLALTVLPEGREREFLGFVRPGADRDSFSRTFLSVFRPDAPRSMHTNVRGEPRPCVSCGYCEDICPAGIMPHWLYKCLTTDRLEEAEQMGLELCLGCGLCTYVCPSKIELRAEFKAGKAALAMEKE